MSALHYLPTGSRLFSGQSGRGQLPTQFREHGISNGAVVIDASDAISWSNTFQSSARY